MDKKTAKTIVLVIAVLGFIIAGMAILSGLALLFFGGMFFGTLDALPYAALGSVGSVAMLLLGVIQIWIYYKLMKYVNWARIVVIIFGILSLFSFPIGTVLGALYIYFLGFNKDIRALFK